MNLSDFVLRFFHRSSARRTRSQYPRRAERCPRPILELWAQSIECDSSASQRQRLPRHDLNCSFQETTLTRPVTTVRAHRTRDFDFPILQGAMMLLFCASFLHVFLCDVDDIFLFDNDHVVADRQAGVTRRILVTFTLHPRLIALTSGRHEPLLLLLLAHAAGSVEDAQRVICVVHRSAERSRLSVQCNFRVVASGNVAGSAGLVPVAWNPYSVWADPLAILSSCCSTA